MKSHYQKFVIFAILFFVKSLENYYYPIDDVFQYLDGEGLDDQDYQSIIDSLRVIFSNSYAFYDIAKNPPQPSKNYHSIVDIEKKLKEINPSNMNSLEFYRIVFNSLSGLKDPHIRLFMDNFDFNYFNILGPFDYIIKEYQGKQRMFIECQEADILNLFDDPNEVGIAEFCLYSDEKPIKSINNRDPFEFVNNFGGNYVATKNGHGTFSFKMKFHNDVSLRDYPLTYEELSNNLEVIFDDEDQTNITTNYIFKSDIYIYDSQNYLRSLRSGRGFYAGKFFKEGKFAKKKNIIPKREIHKNKNNRKFRNLSSYIPWNYKENDFKCYADEGNKINIYYITSFEPENRQKFIDAIVNCVKLFDKNTFPIVVINELNSGGYISLSQLFMGVLSPLIPINLYKGRFRVTEGLKDTKEISEYIKSNFTSITNCEKANFTDLINGKVSTNYSRAYLTQMLYLNNKTIHNQIEEIRANMTIKRKPTEILVLTDGYSFSSCGLYIKYLQKMGGAIIAGFNGNPYSKEIFDSSQSPSAVFIKNLLKLFNPDEIEALNSYNINLEIPGIQTFYDAEDKDIPLEYEITPVDIRLDLYQDFSDETYDLFIEQCLEIFRNIENKCYPNLMKFDENCDKNFKKYKHGGYKCHSDGTWSHICVEAYCDIGYSFNKKEKRCLKDVCSSIPIDEDDSESDKSEGSFINHNQILFLFATLLFIG